MTHLKTGKILSSDFVSLKCNKFKNLKKAKKEVFSFNSSLFWLKTKCYKTNKPQNLKRRFTLGSKISKDVLRPGHVLVGWAREKEVHKSGTRTSIHFISQYHSF